MKTIETVLYSFDELSESAKRKVISRQAKNVELDYSEMRDSLKSICEACDLCLVDYSYGPFDRGHNVQVTGHAEDLEGRKALAWFLRILISNGYTRPRTFAEMEFPGICGFAGGCYDDDLIEVVWKSLLGGSNVRRAFDDMSYELCKLCEAELTYQQSEECILEYLDQSVEIYTEDGAEF